jgi:hypothetical protein
LYILIFTFFDSNQVISSGLAVEMSSVVLRGSSATGSADVYSYSGGASYVHMLGRIGTLISEPGVQALCKCLMYAYKRVIFNQEREKS